jgi:y4mF family transcriptional regulator
LISTIFRAIIANDDWFIPFREESGSAMTLENTEIGKFVRQRRKAAGLTQRELADLAGVGTRFVSEVERGKTTVRVNEVNRVLKVFGRTLGIVEAPKREIEP